MRNRNAFTLIELLVVVAIIIALLAILLPSLGKAVEATNRAVCLSNLKQMYNSSLAYAADNTGSYVARNAIASRFAGGFHDETLAANHPHWGRRWTGYIDSYDYDSDIGHEVLYCPSTGNNGATWKPSFATFWRNTDYAYWPTFAPAAGVNWVSTAPQPPGTIAQTTPTQPLIGDSLFRYRKGQNIWFVAAHAVGGGRNSYDVNVPEATEPLGGNQVNADGGASWYDLADMDQAVHNWGWGADGQDSYQYWAYR